MDLKEKYLQLLRENCLIDDNWMTNKGYSETVDRLFEESDFYQIFVTDINERHESGDYVNDYYHEAVEYAALVSDLSKEDKSHAKKELEYYHSKF